MITEKKEYPVLAAFERDEEGNLSAWCPFCRTFHDHGKGEGHRVAHCTNQESPFKQTGYFLKKIAYKEGRMNYVTKKDYTFKTH